MAKKLYEESHIADIAVAIREKGGAGTYKVAQMADAVRAISGGATVEGVDPLVTYDQQNPLLTQYLAESAGYSPDDYTTSVALSYAYSKPNYIKCHPAGHIVTLKQGGELHLTDGGEVLTKTVEAGDHVLVNTTPNKVAHWWLTVGGSVKQCGTIKPTGNIRMIATPAINVRDLGGWACDGGTVKYGKLFRGGELSTSDRDVLVGQLGIRHDIDLRSKDETGGITKSPLGDEVYYTNPDNYPWYTLAYNEWGLILRTIFNAALHDEPLIFHCAAGSDRTGTVACIIEALLGVSQTDIDRDFELSTFGISLGEGVYEARRRTDIHSDDNPELLRWRDLIEQITSLTVGDTFRDKVVNWVGSLGFSADEINAFRHSMIDGNPEDVIVEGAVSSEYQMVEWARIVPEVATLLTERYECIHSPIQWKDVNRIETKVACVASESNKDDDIVISGWDTATTAKSPYIRTSGDYKFGYTDGLFNYSVTPSNVAKADATPHEYVMTFTSTAAVDLRIGGWSDMQFSHPHDWYYIRLYKDNTMLAEYLPCYRKADGLIGFLDTVSGEFYLNGHNGNGFSAKGNDI